MVSRPLTEDELVERARAGDLDAYERIVRDHEEIAFRTAYLITRDAADAEEAAQDAFIKFHRTVERFRAGEPLRPWLLRIVANEAKNRRRSAGRHDRLALRVAGERPSGDAAPSPEAALLSGERRDALVAALGELTEQDRLVIAFRYFLDLSEEEMAAALGCRRGTVKSRLSRALDRMRGHLGEGER